MFDNLPSWLAWIEDQHHSAIDLGLERVQKVYDRLALGVLAKKVVTIAGTNGKGSTIAALQGLLLSSDVSVGAYTSPHILSFNERVCLNGQAVEDDVLCDAFAKVKAAQKNISLSFFEFTTLAALYIFAQNDLDIVLLEVGLGGRLDAVNIIDADIAVITSIALDHQDWLGDDLQSIAYEKSGIVKQNKIFVCGDISDANALACLKERARHMQACSYFFGEEFGIELSQQGLAWYGGDAIATVHYVFTALQLPTNSVACALQVYCLLGYANQLKHLLADVSALSLAGRYQRVLSREGVVVIFDVAHNPAAAELLSKRLQAEKTGRTIAVFSALRDKDIVGIVKQLQACFDHWHIAKLHAQRAQTQALLLEQVSQVTDQVSLFSSVVQAFDAGLNDLQQGDLLVVFGSFLIVAELQNHLKKTGVM